MATPKHSSKKRGRPPKAVAAEAPPKQPPAQQPAPPARSKRGGSDSDAVVGFEEKLWQMADKLRNNMDAAEYKHVVLGLIFLKYISDSFEEKHAELTADRKSGADPEDPDEYRAENIFWVPKAARWSHLQGSARQATIGKLLDDAMVALEAKNPSLKGVLPKDYGRPALDKTRLGELIDLVGTIGLGDKHHRSRDVLGRVYEYFLTKFAASEGKNGGQFYTPRGVVRVLVEMLAPYKGRVFDPACGSGGMFISSEKFVEAHGGRVGDISIYGQESNHTTWRLAKLNLAIRGIDANIVHGDSFPMFASFALDRPETRAWISQHAIGATMPNLNTGILSAVPLVMPSDDVLRAFARAVDPLQALVVIRDAEAGQLASARDRLLPALLSGELSVAPAEREAEAFS